MPEQLLHAPKVGSALEEVRRERVAEQVGMNPLGLEPCLAREAAEDLERARARERPPARIEEELGPVAPVQVGPSVREVAAERVGGLPSERNDALFPAFAQSPDEAPFEVDRAPLETNGFADAQAAAVEDLNEGGVPLGARSGSHRRVDEALDLAGRERPRQPARSPRQLELGCGVLVAPAEQHEVPEEGAGGGDAPGHGCGRETLVA